MFKKVLARHTETFLNSILDYTIFFIQSQVFLKQTRDSINYAIKRDDICKQLIRKKLTEKNKKLKSVNIGVIFYHFEKCIILINKKDKCRKSGHLAYTASFVHKWLKQLTDLTDKSILLLVY